MNKHSPTITSANSYEYGSRFTKLLSPIKGHGRKLNRIFDEIGYDSFNTEIRFQFFQLTFESFLESATIVVIEEYNKSLISWAEATVDNYLNCDLNKNGTAIRLTYEKLNIYDDVFIFHPIVTLTLPTRDAISAMSIKETIPIVESLNESCWMFRHGIILPFKNHLVPSAFALDLYAELKKSGTITEEFRDELNKEYAATAEE